LSEKQWLEVGCHLFFTLDFGEALSSDDFLHDELTHQSHNSETQSQNNNSLPVIFLAKNH
jgi:hypothetical protein